MRPSQLRRLTGGFAALVLVGATVLSTASITLAAVPLADVSIQGLPGQYTAGNLAGFRATFLNKDTSTVSQLFLNVTTTGSDPDGTFYASGRVQGATVSGACSQSSPFQCSFRNVKPGYLVVVDLAFTPTGGTATAAAVWSSVGGPTTDGGNSHGDTWDAGTASAGLSTSTDYAGGFKVSANGTVSNIQVVSASNLQATRLANLPGGVAATVLDGPTATGTCTTTSTINCSTLIGEWSEVTVGDGQSFSSLFTVAITFYKGSPKAFVHSYLDTSVVPAVQAQELIQVCAKANPTYPCFTWDSKTKTATIFTLHNGSFKGQ